MGKIHNQELHANAKCLACCCSGCLRRKGRSRNVAWSCTPYPSGCAVLSAGPVDAPCAQLRTGVACSAGRHLHQKPSHLPPCQTHLRASPTKQRLGINQDRDRKSIQDLPACMFVHQAIGHVRLVSSFTPLCAPDPPCRLPRPPTKPSPTCCAHRAASGSRVKHLAATALQRPQQQTTQQLLAKLHQAAKERQPEADSSTALLLQRLLPWQPAAHLAAQALKGL